jgi:hypothetical protein
MMGKHNLQPIDSLMRVIDKRVAEVVTHDRRTVAARVLLRSTQDRESKNV